MFDTTNKSFCVMAWIHMYTQENGQVYPCCMWSDNKNSMGNIKNDTFGNVYNGEKAQNIRQKMIDGEKIKGCSKCYAIEDIGGISFRQTANKITSFNRTPDIFKSTIIEKINIKSMDIRLSNKCNLRCVTCGPHASSAWSVEEKLDKPHIRNLIPIQQKEGFQSFKEDLLEPYVRNPSKIYFAGGEPLIIDDHYQVLQYYIDSGTAHKIQLTYNLNFSVPLIWKNKDIFEHYWRHFQNVHLGASLDHIIGKKLEYIRFPIRLNQVSKNLKWLKEKIETQGVVKINSKIAVTISIFNIFDLIEIRDFYLKEYNLELMINILFTPECFAISNIPTEIKEKILIPKLEGIPEFEFIVNHLKTPIDKETIDRNNHSLLTFIQKIDTRRNISFAEYFPEDHYKEWLTAL